MDFGAGKLNNTRTLRNAGVFVSAFEPYFVTTGDTIHKEKSIEIANKFLDEVESGVEYTSVFISSVFNSVPFMEDRIKIAQIAAALCSPGGRVVCWCQSNESQQFVITKKHSVTRVNTPAIISMEGVNRSSQAGPSPVARPDILPEAVLRISSTGLTRLLGVESEPKESGASSLGRSRRRPEGGLR